MHIKPVIGELKLGSIKRREISQVLKQAQQKGLGPQTRVHIYNLLHKIFDDAIVHFEYIRMSPVVKTLKPSIPIEERKFLKPEESYKILEASQSKWYGVGIWLCLLTGMRISELQALTWDSVDFKKKQILIKASYCRKEKKLQNFPKQRKWGRVPMTPDLVSFLRRKRLGKSEEGFVLESPNGGMLKYYSFYENLNRLTKEVGVTAISVHELRHSCTELYISKGASAEDIRRLLNQSSLSATSRYIHKTHERLESIADQITVNDQFRAS